MKKRTIQLTVVGIVGLFIFAGCGSANETAASDQSSSTAEKKEIVVATSGGPKPFTYVNEENELTGYDIELVKAIFAELPDYEVTFEKTEFASVLSGLDTNRYQIGANNFGMNDERKEKYIYSDPIFQNQYVIAVAENVDDIQSFEDLKGRTTEVTPGVNYTTALENYNKENPDDQVILQYSEGEMLTSLQNLESGKYDFQLISRSMAQQYIDEHDLKLKLIDLSQEDSDRIGAPYSYLLLSKTDDSEELVKEVNEALKTVIDNGTATKLSEEFLGGDYAPK